MPIRISGLRPRHLPKKLLSLLLQLSRLISFFIFERLLPIKKKYWCFCTWPGEYAHTLDNPRAIFEEIKDDPSIVKIILQHNSNVTSTTTKEGSSVRFIKAESLLGAYYLARANVILLGYSLSGMTSYSRFLTRKHIIIQLWHGIPLKKIGQLFEGETHWDAETKLYAAAVCSSEKDQKTMTAAFSPIAPENVWLTGLPRNDTFLKDEKELPTDYKNQLAKLEKTTKNRKLVLYAPTWRESKEGIYSFSQSQKEKIDSLMNKYNAVFAIRGHANESDLTKSTNDSTTGSILYVNDFPDVNLILRKTDVLITDYSSIYIDFLLTEKPILHFTYDIDSYVGERGFLYNLKEAMASDYFRTFEELLHHLEQALENKNIIEEKYDRARNLFHSHTQHSAKAVTDRIKSLAI